MDERMMEHYRTQRSQQYFTHTSLSVYDFLVLKLIARFAWQSPLPILIQHYQNFITSNHLEVGVGTGYLLAACERLNEHTRLGLMDLNRKCLKKTRERLIKYNPEIYWQDILKPIEFQTVKFNSIALNFVMHCVPGHFKEKGVAFRHLKTLLKEGGVLFGSTILWEGKKNLLAQILMKNLNTMGIFNNTRDTKAALFEALNANFKKVEIEIVGTTALFCASD